ncbi:hypothetical protein DITRI_Ditri15bG0047700 [Diplodiscus trichospermus]
MVVGFTKASAELFVNDMIQGTASRFESLNLWVFMKKMSCKYAWMLDKFKVDSELSATIDIALRKFETLKFYCTAMEILGHYVLMKNTITDTFSS